MEALGKRQLLEEFKAKKSKTKLIFQYPATDRAIIKSGQVIKTFDDSFLFDETMDGKVQYSYDFLVEIKEDLR